MDARFGACPCESAAREMMTTSRIAVLLGTIILTLVWPSASPRAAQESLSATEIYARVAPSIVFIETDTGSGTGFVVSSEGLIATAWHVIEDAKFVRITLESGEVFARVDLLAADMLRDIALIRIPGFGLPSVVLGNSQEVQPGAPVFVIGNPTLGSEQLRASISDGLVAGRRVIEDGFTVFQHTAPASPGSSGGPMLASNGTVIGIVSFRHREEESLNFAVPINSMRGLIEFDRGEVLQSWEPEDARRVSASLLTRELPSAEEIIADYLGAIGGAEAIRAHSSVQARGTMEMVGQGMEIRGEVRMYGAAPNKSLLVMSFPDEGFETKMGYNGEVAWALDPMTGGRFLQGDELQQIVDEADYYSELHDPSKFQSLETLGLTEYAGRAAYQVKLVYISGREVFEYFDEENGLLLGVENPKRYSQTGETNARTLFSEYQQFGDMMVPTTLIQVLGSGEAVQIKFTAFEYDNVDPSIFDLPASIRR